MTVLLGIDVGTTNWKVGAFTPSGKLLHFEKTPAVMKPYGEGDRFYDPDQLWGSIVALLRKVVEACGDNEIAAISVSSLAESVVPIDDRGEPLFPIIPWFDTCASQEAAFVVEQLGAERLFQITGIDPNPIFSLNKILWVKNHYPDIYDQAVVWLQMADYIYYRLSGVRVTDPTLACRTLAYDIYDDAWSKEILDAVGVSPQIFPHVGENGAVIGGVNAAASTVTGLKTGTPVVLGGNDHPCATIAAGVLLGNKILDSCGTAESFLYIVPKDAKLHQQFQGGRVCSYLDRSRYAVWGGIIASGASIDWGFNRLVDSSDWGSERTEISYPNMMQAIAKSPVGANGIVYLPHLRGSGAPSWNPKSRGAFLGLRSQHTSMDMMKALFEGLSFQARMVIEMEEAVAGQKAEALSAVGGGARLEAWQQIKANVTGKVVEISDVKEASALGAALLAGVGVGIFENVDDAASKIDRQTTLLYPDPQVHKVYQDYYELYKEANQVLRGFDEHLEWIINRGESA